MSDIFGIRRLVVAHIEKSTNRVEVSSVVWGMRPGHALDANEGRGGYYLQISPVF